MRSEAHDTPEPDDPLGGSAFVRKKTREALSSLLRRYRLYPLYRWLRAHASGLAQRSGLNELRRRMRARGFLAWRELVPSAEFEKTLSKVLDDSFPNGDLHSYLEFGVSRGTSLASMYHLFNRRSDSFVLYGFDSFEGMPDGSEAEGWGSGAYASTLRATTRYLANHGVDLDRVILVKGWFDETLTAVTRRRFALQHADVFMFDCDTYSSTAQALRFSESLIGDRALLIFDDWGWRSDRGEKGQKEAFDEFVKRNPSYRLRTYPPYIEQARILFLERET